MANVDLKNVESMRKARAAPHRLDVVSESRPADASETLTKFKIASIPGSENSHDSENSHEQITVLVSNTISVPQSKGASNTD